MRQVAARKIRNYLGFPHNTQSHSRAIAPWGLVKRHKTLLHDYVILCPQVNDPPNIYRLQSQGHDMKE